MAIKVSAKEDNVPALRSLICLAAAQVFSSSSSGRSSGSALR